MSGLNGSEIAAVRESWSAVMRDKVQSGNTFLIRLFTTHPVTQNYFRKFKGKPLDQLKNDPALSMHSGKIMDGLNTVVQSLDDGVKLGRFVEWMSKFHFNQDIKLEYLKYAFGVLIVHFKEVFDSQLSQIGWEKAFNNVHNRLEDEYKSLSRMTAPEIANVRELWDLVMQRKQAHGDEFFIRLFKKHPETLDYFKNFRGRNVDDLRNDSAFSEQAGKIMDGINSVITSMDDPMRVWTNVHWLGKFHYNMNIKIDYFKSFFAAIVSYLNDTFGSRFNRATWEKCFGIIYNNMADEYDRLEGLNAGELSIVRENWALILQNKKMHGNQFLYRLFKAQPKTQDFFEKFQGMSVEDLKTLPALTVHSGKIMDGLTNLVSSIDDDKILQSHIDWMVGFHTEKGIKLDYFKSAFGVLTTYFEDVFGDRLSKEVWAKFFDIVYGRLADGYRRQAFLTDSEIADVRSSWALLMRNKRTNGREFFIRLFKAYPAVQDIFGKFEGKSVEELRTCSSTSPSLLAHSEKIMGGLDNMVSCLDDNRKLNNFIEWMATFHYNMGVKEDYLQDGFAVLIAYLQDILGGRLNKSAWDKTVAILHSRLVDEYQRVAGLNSTDVASVEDCWKTVMQNKQQHANEFFIRLFKTRPAAKSYFQKFRNSSVDELRNTSVLSAHSVKIFDGINNLIEALEKKPQLDGHLKWMASFHYKMNLQVDFFKDAFGVLVAYLQDTLGSKVNKDSWEKTMAVVYRRLTEEYKKIEDEQL